MSRNSISLLPEGVQSELTEKYFSERYLSLDDHVAWLSEKGYTVSRSALQRYMASRKNPLLESEHERKRSIQHEQSVRFRCLEIASRMYSGDDQQELLGLAEDLIDWIEQTDSSRNPVA